MRFIRDLFMNVGNSSWDLGRIGAAFAIAMMLGAAVWNMLLGLPIELGPSGFGGGLAAVLTSAAAFVYAKDRARSETVVARTIENPGGAKK